MFDLYHSTCDECSALITRRYSTSFSAGIRAFHPSLRMPIYAIYGFVRFADEIVDTFYDFPQEMLFRKFKADTYAALADGISLNPVLHAFQNVVRQYGIERPLIDAFLDSMEMDLSQCAYSSKGYSEYIYGSAEVVGLMCLHVFCEGDSALYEQLKMPARRLGAAFQKINFLRDIKSDFEDRGRVYFPGVDFSAFTPEAKRMIELDIAEDFREGHKGILRLPPKARFGVYLAYRYYLRLFKKIRRTPVHVVQDTRIRVSDPEKLMLLFRSSLRAKLNML